MKIYSTHGVNDFVICCGYKGHLIKEYILDYARNMSDLTVDMTTGQVTALRQRSEPWRVTLVDTGENTMTGGRLLRVREHVGDETFCLTYGDGVSDIDIRASIAFHRKAGHLATLAAVQPPGRFGAFTLHQDDSRVSSFREKPQGDNAWINGGFFVLEPGVFDYIESDATVWEREPMERLAHDGKLGAYRHTGYWQNMDTLRDKNVLEELWSSGKPPWKIWS
jgi:glucose-1-phosphate cytidylyltransferase